MFADGIVHVLGLSLGLVGAVAIVIVGAQRATGAELFSVIVYTTGLLAMLGASAAYNLWPVSPWKWLLRRFDHSAIYLLIAATYTPFLVQLKDAAVGSVMLIGIWLVAGLGMAVKLTLPGRLDRTAIGLYLALGWSGMAAYDAVKGVLPVSALWLLLAGGVLYSVGVIFHAWRTLKFQNAIWHGFVVAAATCHYFAVLETVAFAG
jgi:hemolysin III